MISRLVWGSVVATAFSGLMLAAAPQNPPDDVRPSGGRPACRYYPTSMTETVTSDKSTGISAFVGEFNPKTLEADQRVTYSDSAGSRFNYRQVTKYLSVSDFVHEVVRSSGWGGAFVQPSNVFTVPAGLFESTDVGRGVYVSHGLSDTYRTVGSIIQQNSLAVSGAPAPKGASGITWNVSTIPPLNLWKSARLSGDINVTTENFFTARGQVQRTVTKTQTATMTTEHSAWDKYGRPTAGTQTGGGASSTMKYEYDDLKRTLTHSVSGGGASSVTVSTFDWNGNPVQRVAKAGPTVGTTRIQTHALAVQCSGPITTPTTLPPAVGAPAPGFPSRGTINASINGTAWVPKVGVGGTYREEVMSPAAKTAFVGVSGTDEIAQLSVMVSMTHGPGEYKTMLELPKDPRELFRGVATVSYYDAKTQAGWFAGPGSGKGTVTIESASATGATGRFSATLEPIPGTNATGTRTVTGTFVVKF